MHQVEYLVWDEYGKRYVTLNHVGLVGVATLLSVQTWGPGPGVNHMYLPPPKVYVFMISIAYQCPGADRVPLSLPGNKNKYEQQIRETFFLCCCWSKRNKLVCFSMIITMF